MIKAILISSLFIFNAVHAQEHPGLKLIFTGDIMGHDSQIASALETGKKGYDYDPCFALLKPYISSADISIGNLELTLAGPPYKGYPRFSSPDELGEALSNAGFDVLLTANNHALDRNKQGLERTIEQLDEKGIIHIGTYANEYQRAASYPLILEKNGIRLALLNYTYGTNGLKVETPNIVNYIDKEQIATDLEKATKAEPDFTIVTLHWGKEYELTENKDQQALADYILSHGADAIIGSHPHVVQPITASQSGEIIVYSMGNFISNQRSRYRDGGISVELELEKSKQGTFIRRHAYLPVWVYKRAVDNAVRFELVPASIDRSIADHLQMPEEDFRKMKTFLNDTRTQLRSHPEVEAYWMYADDRLDK